MYFRVEPMFLLPAKSFLIVETRTSTTDTSLFPAGDECGYFSFIFS